MKTTVTFIPGMFSPFINAFLGTYFVDQMEYLEKRGVPYDLMPVHTEGSLEKNALVIRQNLESRDEVVAFCHSKGGVDLLHALIAFPELRPKFKKIVFMQCPFYGTPLADLALKNNMTKAATKGLFKGLLNGDVKSISELTQLKRKEYMQKHESHISAIMNSIHVECIGSSKLPEKGKFDSILKISRDFIQYKFDMANDGMIPMESALIPGSRQRIFKDLDHATAVIRLTPQAFDRRAFSHEIFHGALA